MSEQHERQDNSISDNDSKDGCNRRLMSVLPFTDLMIPVTLLDPVGHASSLLAICQRTIDVFPK